MRAGGGGGGAPPTLDGTKALEIRVRGVVQGVGFRPFVHRLALRHGLRGWVRNDAGSVTLRVQGDPRELAAFQGALRSEAPPLARIDGLESESVPPGGWEDFRVIPSEVGGEGVLPISPDVAVCCLCLEESRDPRNRRYRYPFITCTDCGPRFTVIREMPYDRERTSMASFRQCPRCLAEYGDPTDRRYHSETNSCPQCGPRIWYEASEVGGKEREGPEEVRGTEAVLSACGSLLTRGGILALRGLGGFHLAVDATDEAAVVRLRERKGREEKPLAVMVRDVEEARTTGVVGEVEEELLGSPQRPIVLLRAAQGSPLAPSIAPGLDTVGVMTPYTPLHHLLLEGVGRPLVMTSGNRSDEPIATGNDEARARLGDIADGFLFHDREIVARYDDSVVRRFGESPVFLRRSRGYAPLPLALPVPAPVPLLAVGPHLKNTFTLVAGSTAYVSQHVGDLESVEVVDHFREALKRFQDLFGIRPRVLVRDLHPGYLSTRLARELAREWGLGEPLSVQHHHAHMAAVMAERGGEGSVVGVAFDGTGYGEDGRVWGGEILVGDLTGFRRVGQLRYAPLPGGEAAVRNPWRTAMGYLSLEPWREGDFALALDAISGEERAVVRAQALKGVNAPLASSMGRLFDAASAVLGLRGRCGYDGQAAMELEATADWGGRAGRPGPPALEGGGAAAYPFPWRREGPSLRVMDPLPLLASLGRARQEGVDPTELARAFHGAVIRTTREVVLDVCREEGLGTVALGGGVFQNAILMEGLTRVLEAGGLEVLTPRVLSPNDGAVSYGQAAVAAAQMAGGVEGLEEYPMDEEGGG